MFLNFRKSKYLVSNNLIFFYKINLVDTKVFVYLQPKSVIKMKKTKLRNLKDNAKFYLSKERKATTYTLLKLDKKNKTATYQSNSSTRTSTRSWDLECLVSK
jgi:hypothetical protein